MKWIRKYYFLVCRKSENAIYGKLKLTTGRNASPFPLVLAFHLLLGKFLTYSNDWTISDYDSNWGQNKGGKKSSTWTSGWKSKGSSGDKSGAWGSSDVAISLYFVNLVLTLECNRPILNVRLNITVENIRKTTHRYISMGSQRRTHTCNIAREA